MATAPSTSQRERLFDALSALADEIQVEKTAAAAGHEKTGAPTPPDPGGYQGASTHPTADADNSAQVASEGERSSENTSDVKADQGAPAVDSTSEATPNQDEQDQHQLNIGTQQSATGEDPSVEDDYKGTKDDPGTSHPAQTEDGEKYGSFKEAHAAFNVAANEVLADLANGFGTQLAPKTAESADPKSRPETSAPMTPAGGSAEGEHVQPGGGGAGKSKKEEKPKEAAAATPSPESPLAEPLQKAADAISGTPEEGTDVEAMQAGYELATALGLTKEAAQDGVKETIAQTIRDAETDADLFGSYFTTFIAKQGAVPPDEAGGEPHADPNDASSGANEAGEAAGGGAPSPEAGGGAPGGAPPGLAALLGGGGGMGGEMGGEMGGLGGGEPSPEEALAELAAALEELGIPLEALIEAGGAGGGMGGEMGTPPMEGAPPAGPMGGPEGAAPLGGGMEAMAGDGQPKQNADLVKLATAVRDFKRSGKYQIKAATDPRQRQLRDEMKIHVREMLGIA
jgi:hypothetical protein